MLDAALASARAGHGRVVLLVGEPGIGKTRLAEEFTRRATAAGAEVLAGRCFEGPGAPAFWPWVQVLREYAGARDVSALAAELGAGASEVAAVVSELHDRLPGLPSPAQVAPDQARFRFFDAVTRALMRASAAHPVAVVLDDLHGADAPSLLLLQFLARELRTSNVIVVGTLRTVALAPGHPLADTVGELVREQVSEQLDLGGLACDDVAALMAQMGSDEPPRALVEAVHARTEGNPLYVAEIVRMLTARGGYEAASVPVTVPATVRLAIGRHLGVLSSEARETLTLAALFGREFRTEIVARAGSLRMETVLTHVDEAVESRILAADPGQPGRYRFAHALFGEVLIDALGEARRVALHRDAASALAAEARAEDVVPEIAHHWFAAGSSGDPAQAVAWTRRAGDKASTVFAYEEAADWYRRALTALGWMPEEYVDLRAELLLGLGEAAKRAGMSAAAKEAFEKAASIGRARDSATILTRAALGYAPAVTFAEHPAPDLAVMGLLEEAIAAWRGQETSLHALALARLGLALVFGDDARRDTALAASLEMARHLAAPGPLIQALAATLRAGMQRGEVETRLALATELVRLAEPARELEALAAGRLWRCTNLLELGDVGAAQAEHSALRQLADEIRQPVWRWYARVSEPMFHRLSGDFASEERAIQEAFDLGRSPFPYAARGYFLCQMLSLRIFQGRPYPYAAECRAMQEMHPDPAAVSPIAWMEYEAGHLDEARKLIDRLTANDCAAALGSLSGTLSVTFLAEMSEIIHPTEAARLYDYLAPKKRHWLQWAEGSSLGPIAHSLGLFARKMGRVPEAAAHFEDAIAACRRVGARPFLARALYEYAVLLRSGDTPGNSGRVSAMLDEAHALAEAIGMAKLARRIATLRSEGPAGTDAASVARTALRQEGDYWAVSFAGTTIRLRDSRGLGYLAMLLKNPGREFHATELVGGNGSGRRSGTVDDGLTVRRSIDDGSPVLADARAQAAYRTRMRDLDEELTEAEGANDLGRAARLRDELSALREAVVASVRAGRSGTQGERARLTATKGIGAALARIDRAHPVLGAHLRATVRRGYFCAYVPDPRHPITWDE